MKMRKLVWLFAFIFVLIAALPISANDGGKIRLGVIGFESKTKTVTQSQAGYITDVFTRIFANSKNMSVYERQKLADIGKELNIGASGLVDPKTAAKVGKIAGVQYVLLGSISETSKSTITVDIRIIDTTTSEITLTLAETVPTEGASGRTVAHAMSDAANMLAYEVRSILGGESSSVIDSEASGVLIDTGLNMGVKEGDIFLVYAEGKTIRGMRGEDMGREKIPLAVIKVKDVSALHSSCSITPPSDPKMVRRGDKVVPIVAEKVRNLKLAGSRPTTGTSPERGTVSPPEVLPQMSDSAFIGLCRTGTPQQVEAAIKGGANVHAKSEDGMTILMYAAKENSNPEVITILVKAGANVHAVDKKGRTPLMHAAWFNDTNHEIITALVKAGADVNARDNDGTTPLKWAAQVNYQPQVIITFLNAGADVHAKDKNGKRAIDYANDNEHIVNTDAYRRLQAASK